MSAAPDRDDWRDLVAMIRRYTLRRYGVAAEWVAFGLGRMGEVRDVIPPGPTGRPGDRPAGPRPSAVSGWASGPDPKHLSDFRQVYRPGLLGRDGSPAGPVFTFSAKQALAVGELWAAEEGGSPEVQERQLLAAADSDSDRLADLFKRHPAWGTLIVRGVLPGTFRLAGPADAPDEEG